MAVRFIRLVAVSLLALVALLPGVAGARATTIQDREIVPFETVAFIDCPGIAEEIHLTGELLLLSTTVVDANGGFHARFTLVPRHVRGVGLTSGTTYKAVGGDRSHFNVAASGLPLVFTNTDMFNLVSQGGTANQQFRFTFHIRIGADGTEMVVDHFTAACRG